MPNILIHNANIVNEGKIFRGSVLIENERIKKIIPSGKEDRSSPIEYSAEEQAVSTVIDATDLYLLPGAIDDQVHFREPGLTHKADIYTESKAAVAGGITSFMEMPNTVPNTLTQELLAQKYRLASEKSLANYSFYMGASNDNLEEVLKTNHRDVCGIKIFMGSSTGNMLVDNRETLNALFSQSGMLIAAHCEDEETIRKNSAIAREKYGEDVPVELHPIIRNEEACYKSSSLAVELATKHGARLHILHLSSTKELALFSNKLPLSEKKITAEACIHHLWFSDADYKTKGTLIKWNPAVKTIADREAILEGVLNDKIDVIATDHAPHTLEEKQALYFKCPSGAPMVQHALIVMLELYHRKKISLEKIVRKMSHDVALMFSIKDRGYIREGYFADLVLVNLHAGWTVEKSNLLYKCGWSPLEGQLFHSQVTHTFVNGALAYENSGEGALGKVNESVRGKRLFFER